MKLTKRTVEALAPNSVAWCGAVIGFGARRQRSAAIKYVLRYRLNGAQRWISIGRHGSPWTCEDARAEALRLLGQLVSGADPKGPSSAELFGVEAQRYLERKRPEMKARSFGETARHLLAHAKPLHSMKLTAIDQRTIALRLAEIETASGPVARNRVRSSLSAFFSWAIREGLCELNPVAGTGKASENGSRERVLSPKEIAAIWTKFVGGQHTAFCDVIRLQLLTGQRRNEIADLRQSEIDFDRRVIVLPASRTKNKREHIVPLSEPALEILRRAMPDAPATHDGENDGRVFHSFSWSDEKAKLDAGLRIAPWTLHDLRRTCATQLNDLGFAQPHHVEAILNHVSGHKAGVAGTYNCARYLDECRAALDRWAEWIVASAAS
jgi:integrase